MRKEKEKADVADRATKLAELKKNLDALKREGAVVQKQAKSTAAADKSDAKVGFK